MYLWILQILMQLTFQPQILEYDNFLTVTGPHLTCRNWLRYPEVPVAQHYKHMINTSEPVHSFTIKDDDKDPSFIWTI